MPRFPFRKIAERLEQGDCADTAKDKGDALENAICLCFNALPGLNVIETNIVSNARSQEIDVAVYNEKNSGVLPFFDSVILIECKNWSSAVDCKAVRDFVGKVRKTKLKTGVLVAASGVTGDPDEVSSAYDELRTAFDADSIMIFVMTREQLVAFRTAPEVVSFFKRAYLRLILRQTLF